MEQVSLSINGKTVIAYAGTSIFKSALENRIRIPSLCNHPQLPPAGACRLCMVEDEKSGRMMASCVTPVASGMTIRTESEALRRHRTNIVRLLMANHPDSCLVCSKGNRCELRSLAAELGVAATGLYPMPHFRRFEDGNPFIVRDLTKCILCGRCIRADHDLVGMGAIDYNLRGFRSRPATVHDLPLEKSTCTFCGTCVSLCPTGALTARNGSYAGSPEREAATVCGFCGVGCSLVMGSAGGRVVEVNPSRRNETVNQGTLCVRGHFAHDFLNAGERATTPLVRKEGEMVKAGWQEALDLVAERLLSIRARYGPQSIGFLGSSKCTNEENYLFQRIARVALTTNNVDSGGALRGRAVWEHFQSRLGAAGRVNPLSHLEQVEAILVVGADPGRSAPVLGYHIRRASLKREVPVIVIDPRKTDLVPFSSLWLSPEPETDSELIHAISAILMGKEEYDADFIVDSTEGFREYRESLALLTLQRASRITGIEIKAIEEAAKLLAGKRIAFVFGHGISFQRYGIQAVDALVNLALLTGSIGKGRGGFYAFAGENNETGARDMGSVPDILPGRLPLSDGALRKQWERAWHASLSPDPGLGKTRMIMEAEKGNLKALYVMGENPVRAYAGSERIASALRKLELLVVQDILQTETGRLAHIVLPGAAFTEKSGSFTNMEGRIQCFDPVVPLQGDAKPDWEILDLLGRRIGSWDAYRSIQNIRYEIGRSVPGYADLGKRSSTWVKETKPATTFRLLPYTSHSKETAPEGYPFKAILGTPRVHVGAGTRTSSSSRIREYGLLGEAEISPQSAASLGIGNGEEVNIASPYGAIRRKIVLNDDIKPGLLFVPRAVRDNDAASLLPLISPAAADAPGINAVPVKIGRGINDESSGSQS
ncbi:MAG: 4Fe-4S dicluster domain-containing protein [Desulfobacteraceae bacterium]|nr:MAG: 4Fe-4S dicluster domain-containing protein [Desulfobacteraceae bacterium]